MIFNDQYMLQNADNSIQSCIWLQENYNKLWWALLNHITPKGSYIISVQLFL
jgi:hypothetical protein